MEKFIRKTIFFLLPLAILPLLMEPLLRNIPTTYSEIQPRNITFESGNVLVNETIVITKPSLA